MKKAIGIILAISVSFVLVGSLFGQESDKKPQWFEPNPDFKIQPFMMVQLWGVYSTDMQADTDRDGMLESAEDRMNLHMRRARLGFRAEPYKGLKFTVVAYYDGLGRDALGASIGGANNPHGTEFGIWDAFFQYKVSKKSDKLVLTGGFFRPQLGRESITSGFATTSGEKAMQQNYIRRHLVGTGPGRAVGLNAGGLFYEPDNSFHWSYNVGYFNPQNTSSLQNTVGMDKAGLYVGRLVLGFGDPESKNYKIGYQTNYYNQRYGLSVGLAGSYQDQTDLFTKSYSYGFDFLLNWGAINVDGDWLWMQREDDRNPLNQLSTDSYTGHIRASYNIMLDNGKILEPVAMWMHFNGPEEASEQVQAAALNSYSGTNDTYNLGFNYYLNSHRLKLIAHYVIQEGSLGRNQFYSQSALGVPIERGDYFMVGLNMIF